MHIGKSVTENSYKLFGNSLTKVEGENDLGVIVRNHLKLTKHCISALQRTNDILGLIARSSYFKSQAIIS